MSHQLRPLLPLFVLALLMVGGGAPARAQNAGVCQQIRAEMASLGRGGGNPAMARRVQQELGRIGLALQTNDCYRSGGFLGIGGPPPVCAPLKAQAAQLQAQLNAAQGDTSPRRAQLQAAWQRYGCDAPPPAESARARPGVLYAAPSNRPDIIDRLFNGRTEVPVEAFPPRGVAPAGVDPFDDSLRSEDGETPRRRGGGVAVCVRTCDGFFFPVNFEGLRARGEYEEVCQSLCPAAQTRVYFMSQGGMIDDAAARDGSPYTALPAAKKYQEGRDLSCICKQPSQTWASAMKDKQDLVEMRKGDIVVSKEQAEQMSRPKELRLPGARQNDANGTPDTAPNAKGKKKALVRAEDGVLSEITREDGSRASVRNVAPDLSGTTLRSGSGEARRP